jgi:competence protein ComEC
LFLLCCAFAFGVWCAQQQSQLLAVPVLVIGLAVLLITPVLIAKKHALPAAQFYLFLLAFFVGFGYASLRSHARMSDALPAALEGEPMALIGVVANLPQRDDRGVRFELDVERVNGEWKHGVPGRVSLTWFADQRKEDVPTVRAGERWQLAVRLKRPHGFMNPHGFDAEAWLLERGIRATGGVSASDSLAGLNQRLSQDAGRVQDRIDRLREKLRDRIEKTLEHARWAAVIVALAIGDQRGISPNNYALFDKTGISHLLSISGAHVTFFAAACAALTYALWRRNHALTLRLPARKAAAIIAFCAAGIYALFAGFAVPAQRTVFMVGVAALGLWWGRAGSGWSVLGAALALVLLLDPWAVLSAGFWFSFLAVALLFWLSAYRVGRVSWWRRAVATQLAITFALAPVSLALFQSVSIVGVVVNAIAIPWVSFVVVPLSLLALIIPWDFLLHAAHATFGYLAIGLEWAQNLPFALWQQHAPAPWTVIAALFAVAWLAGPRALPLKPLAAVLLLPLFTVKPARPEVGAFSLTALDVGQGQAMVVQTHSHDFIYDAGPRWTDESDAGQRIVVPYLRATGAKRGAMVVSHQDSDHAGGARAVLAGAKLDWWMSSMNASAPEWPRAFEAVPFHRCESGQRWEWDGVRFDVIHPHRSAYSETKKSNDLSCVIRVQGARGERALLTGDAEALAETEMIARGEDLKTDLLSLPHHGSRTSSTQAFIDKTAPQVTIANAGYRNRFGHPRPDVLARYTERGIRVDRTDWHGAVTYRFSAAGQWEAEKYREARQRYWQNGVGTTSARFESGNFVPPHLKD